MMKKIFAVLLATCIAILPTQTLVLADTVSANEEVILSVADAEWTIDDGLAVYDIGGKEYGDGQLTFKGVGKKNADGTVNSGDDLTPTQLGTDTYVTYSDKIPGGVYKVMYYYPNYTANSTYTAGRNATILDNDIEITDANGIHTVVSVKPDITFGGWAEVGVYEFAGNGADSIKVYVNQDNKYVRGQWKKTFMSSQIKLVPVNEDHSELLSAVNAAQTVAALKSAVEEKGGSFVNKNALTYMADAYEEMLSERPQGGFKSAYAFKSIFEKKTSEQLTKTTVASSFFAWQNSESNVSQLGYRINWAPVELTTGESRAVVSFKLPSKLNIKDMKLKLNPCKSNTRFKTNAIVTKYTSATITLPNNNKGFDKFMNSVAFIDLPESDRVEIAAAPRSVGCEKIIDAAEENGYISFFLTAENIAYNEAVQNNYELDAELEVVYDNTYNPSMTTEWSAVNNNSVGDAKVLELRGFDKIDLVRVNKTTLDDARYRFNNSKLIIDGDVFSEEGSYTIEIESDGETRGVSAELIKEKIIYAADDTRAVWSATPTEQANMTAPDTNYKSRGVASFDATLTYSGLPSGAYEVYTYYPKWENISVPAARTSGIMDSSAVVTDKNGTYSIKSTKPSINYEGYTSIGIYEFSGGESEQIKFSVNTDYTDVAAYAGKQWFAHYAIKLVPISNDWLVKYYYEKGNSVIDVINSVKSDAELAVAVKGIADYNENFVDNDILCDMSGVWDSLYKALSEKPFATAYEFKATFDKAVSKYVEFVEIPSSIMLSTYTYDGKYLNVLYKKNGTAGLIKTKEAYVSFTFDKIAELEPEKILGAELKLKVNKYADDFYIKKYSLYSPTYVTDSNIADGNLDANSISNIECNMFFDSFTEFSKKLIVPFGTEIDITEIKKAAVEKTPISYYVGIEKKITDYNDNNIVTGAVLRIKCDKTYAKDRLSAAVQISNADTFNSAKKLTKQYADIFGKNDTECDMCALALWGENIETESDLSELLGGKRDFEMKKGNAILTANEYIGGVVVKNFGTKETPVRVLAASYGIDGNLIGVDFADIEENIPGGEAVVYAFSIDIPEDEVINEVKVFAWGDMIRLAPLTNAIKHSGRLNVNLH